MSPASGGSGGSPPHPSLARCPLCGRCPELMAYGADGKPLDIHEFVASGGDIVPSDVFHEEYRIWALSGVTEWRLLCGCPEPMVSDHRNSLIHRWNARSIDETI